MIEAQHQEGRRSGSHHDWHSPKYVEQWISKDVTRDEERRPFFREMFACLPFGHKEALSVLDVGGGYGVVTEEVLKFFPNSRVTLQDYSAVMFDHARRSLAPYNDRTTFVQSDLAREWTEALGGPFDLAVSAIAIHNLREASLIAKVYDEVYTVLKSKGVFLNMDFMFTGGIDTHMKWLKEFGFARVVSRWYDGRLAALLASKD